MTSGDRPGPCRIVVLLSGSGTNFQAIIDHFQGDSSVELSAAISNRADALGLTRARNAGIPGQVLSHRDFDGREAFDQALIRAIDRYQPDLVVLAGFMRIFTAAFARHYQGRLINIHPSLLPRHRGLNTHQRALEAGDREHGATVHFVTPELDGGPAIMQSRVTIEPNESPERLARRVLAREHQLYPLAIRWLCEGRIRWTDQGPSFDGKPLTKPLEIPEA